MSQHARIGNTFYHRGEEMEVLATHHDETNHIWYRGVKSKDNGGVISTTEWVRQQEYGTFLGAVEMRDYPDDWDELRGVVLERDDNMCQGCGNSSREFSDTESDGSPRGCSTTDSELHVHHIVPLGCGGTNTLRNLITLCDSCHGRTHGGPI